VLREEEPAPIIPFGDVIGFGESKTPGLEIQEVPGYLGFGQVLQLETDPKFPIAVAMTSKGIVSVMTILHRDIDVLRDT
jgi:hypothetical protein